MLLRVVLLAALAAAAWLLLKRFWAPQQQSRRPSEGEYRRMVACRNCGTHVPADEAITYHGDSYCCRDHLPR